MRKCSLRMSRFWCCEWMSMSEAPISLSLAAGTGVSFMKARLLPDCKTSRRMMQSVASKSISLRAKKDSSPRFSMLNEASTVHFFRQTEWIWHLHVRPVVNWGLLTWCFCPHPFVRLWRWTLNKSRCPGVQWVRNVILWDDEAYSVVCDYYCAFNKNRSRNLLYD